jgi:hypothetical protein
MVLRSLRSSPPSKVMKGLKRMHGPRDRIQIFEYKWIVLSVNKNLYWFLNFKYLPLMSCRLCNFLRGDGKNSYIYWSSLSNYLATLLVSYRSLDEFSIPIGPLFQFQYDFLAG